MEAAAAGAVLPLLLLLLLALLVALVVWCRRPAGRVPLPPAGRGASDAAAVSTAGSDALAAGMCSVVDGDGEPPVMTTSYEEWSAVAEDEDQIRTIATADLMEFYANEIVQDLAHRPYMELGIHSDSDSELANVYSGLETILEETSDDMRSDTESLRSGPTSWAWSQDSADVETVIDAGRGRDSRFEDDFNPLDGVDAALAATGKLANGTAPRDTNSDKYRQLFDFEAFLKGDDARCTPSSASEPPSMDPIFATSATQFPFSDSVQVAPLSRPTEPPPPPPPTCAPEHGFRLGPLEGSCHTNPFTSLPACSAEGPPELVFSLEDVLDHRTRLGQPGNAGPAPPPTGQLMTGSRAAGAKVLGTSCNGPSGVSGSTAGGGRSMSRLSDGQSAAGRGGVFSDELPGEPPPDATVGVGPKWDLGSCEDFENLNRRIESLTFDFEEEERRSLEYIVDGDTGSSEEDSGSPAGSSHAEPAPALRPRDCRIKRFHSFGDLSMITEDELQEGGSEHSLTTSDMERWALPVERPRHRRSGHPGLLRHSSENLSEDSGYGDHTGDRVSPPNLSGRSTGLLHSSPPPASASNAAAATSNAATANASAATASQRSHLGRLSKSTSDLSPGSQRRRRLLELISRDEQRRARLYSDAPRSDARLSPPRLTDAPPPVDSDRSETPAGSGDGGDTGDGGDGASDGQTEVESVLVLLENEESNSVIQVLRGKAARARTLDGMAAPVPAPRTTLPRAPAVYQNVPSNARARRAAAPTTAPAEHSTATAPLDRRVKRDIEQFERIKEAFLEKGTYNVHADMGRCSSLLPPVDSRSTPDLSLGRAARGRGNDDRRPTGPARRSTDTGRATGRAGVNKGAAEMEHDPGGSQGHQPSATRAEFEPTDEPRDIYLSESEAQLLPMYRSTVGRPKPLDLKLAEEFLLLEGMEGEAYVADEYRYGRESPDGERHSREPVCVPPIGEEVAAAAGRPITGAGEGERAGPGWTADGTPGPCRSRSLWNLSQPVYGEAAPEPADCDWQRSRNRTGAWLLSKSVQELWSEDNMDSPRRLDYYNQTMEWPGSGDYLACSAERLRSPVSPASSGQLSDQHCAPTRPAPPPPPTAASAPLNLDGGAAMCAEMKFRQPSDICSSWLVASMEPESSEQRSLNGQPFFVEPSAASDGGAAHLNGTAPVAEGSDARTMSVNNSFTARVPVKAYGAGSDVEVYINREPTPSEPRPEQERTTACGDGVAVRTKPRGVQFSPMVSEVQWRESYLEEEPDRRPLNTFQQPQQQQQPGSDCSSQPVPGGQEAAPAAVENGDEQSARQRTSRSPPPAPPPRQTHNPAAPEPPQRPDKSTEQRERPAASDSGGPAVLRPVRPPIVPVVAPRSSASLPARYIDGNIQADVAGKSATIEPVRGRSNGGQASPVTVRTQDKTDKPEKPDKPPKTSVLQRLGLGRLSGRSKPKLPPKPESIKTTSRTPSPASPPPNPPSQPLPSPIGPAQTDGRRPVTSTPVVGPRTASPVPAPVASPVVGQGHGSPISALTPVAGQGKATPSPVTSSDSCQSPYEQSAPKAEFHAPPSPAVRAKSLSLPRAAEIKLDNTPGVTSMAATASPVSPDVQTSPVSTSTAESSGAGRPTAKPPLPPQALRTQTQVTRARLTSARRNFFQLEQQRVIPLRSVPAAPIPDSAPPTAAARPSAATDIKDAFERFRRRAQEDRARLAKSTPDLSLIESATRSIVRPIQPLSPSSAGGPPIDRSCAAAAAGRAASSHSVTLQEEGNVVILHAGSARPASKSRDRFAQRRAAALARARSRSVGVLETDLDAPPPETDLDSIVRNLQQCIDEASPQKEKAKSLLHLDRTNMEFSLPRGADSRAKSMEFLLDDENKTAVQPPENDLMRGERRLSEHELRFQRSLRNLNTPEWYKKSSTKPETTLRKDYGSGSLAGGWSGFNSKSTSKESLQSSRCTTPTVQSKVVIPSRVRTPDWRYVRGTSRESLTSPGSGAASPAVSDRGGLYYGAAGRASQPSSGTQSPVGSAAGSLSGHSRRPVYMGWRSQERLSQGYQTPVDRLASSFSRNRSEGNLSGGRLSLPRGSGASSATGSTSSVSGLRPPPDLDVHSSIREVTSAIVHYFDSSGAGGSASGSASELGGRSGSPRRRRSPAGARGSRSTSPSKRPVWLETAFVGTKPMDEPPTPEAADAVLTDPLAAGGGGGGGGSSSAASSPAAAADPPPAQAADPQGDRYELGGSGARPAPAPASAPAGRRRGSSVTVEDVLDSLLALPSGGGQTQPRRASSTSSKGSRRGASPSRVLYETSLVGTRYYERPPSASDDYPSRNGHVVTAGGGGGWSCPSPQPPPPASPPEQRPNAITTVAWVSSEPEPDPEPDPEPEPEPAGDPPLWEELHSVDSASGEHRQHSGSTDNCASSGDSLQAQVSSPTGDRRLSDSIDGHKVRFDVSDDDWQPGEGGERGVSLEELGRRLPLADDTSDADADTDRSATTTTPVENDNCEVRDGDDGVEPADSFITIKCKNSMCLRTTNLTDAKTVFKMCHNCETFYCSRDCRRAHWERHRRVCAAIRAQAMSKQIILKIKEDENLLLEFSRTARQGYLTHGRGLLKVFFPSPESADDFMSRENGTASEALYIKWQDLLPREMGHLVYRDIIDLCKAYNPETRLVLYIVICVFNELPLSGVAKWERQIIPRCAKLKLSPLLGGRSPQRKPSPKITRELDELETLILISLPHSLPHLAAERAREVNFLNIVRHLRSRGVSLRRDYPEVYNRLCAYSEKNVPFSPTTIYPKDTGTGNTFMCLIMPDATPEQLLKIPRDCGKVKTINISQDRPE